MFKEQFELFFGLFGVDLEEKFEYLQELISNPLAIRRIFESSVKLVLGECCWNK